MGPPVAGDHGGEQERTALGITAPGHWSSIHNRDLRRFDGINVQDPFDPRYARGFG